MPPQRKPQNANDRANEALDKATSGATPARRTLDFLLKGSHDEPSPKVAQPEPSPIQAQTQPNPKVGQSQPKHSPIAPERNYNKRANSLEHSALPAGLFPGASKKIYDALYVRTRGAVVPTRTVQARHRDLLAWSGIRDVKTVKAHLGKLRESGLLSWQTMKGEHEGSLYEVRLPEEVSPDPAQTQPNPSPILKTDLDPAQNLDWVGLPKTVDFKEQTDSSKTSFKTNTEKPDDDWLPGLRAAVKGQNLPKLAALLISLVKLLDSRTDVSSYDGLLAYYLGKKIAHRSNTAQRRPNDEQFRASAVAEFSDEELAELNRIVAEQKAELEKGK